MKETSSFGAICMILLSALPISFTRNNGRLKTMSDPAPFFRLSLLCHGGNYDH